MGSGQIGEKAHRAKRRSLSEAIGRAACLLSDQAGYSVATLVLGMLLARASTRGEFGCFVLGMSMVFLWRTAIRSVINVPYSILRPHLNTQEQRALLGSCLVHQCVGSLGLAVVVLLLRELLLALEQTKLLGEYIWWFYLVAATTQFSDFTRSVLLTGLRLRSSLHMGLALNGGTLGGLLVVFALGALRLSTACGIVALFAILPASVVIHRMRDAIAFAPERLVVDWRTNWAQGRWVLSSTVINVLGVRAMPWLTLLWWSTEVVATVGVVVAVAGLVRPALQATLNYLTPALARTAHVAGARHTIRRGVQLMVAGAVAGAVYVPVMALLGDPLVGVLYSPAYQGERIALVILGAAFGLRAVYVPARATSTALHQSRTLARSSLLGAVVSLAAGCAAIPAWGVTGVAVAILCQAIALLAVNCYDLRGAFQALPGESMDASARGAA